MGLRLRAATCGLGGGRIAITELAEIDPFLRHRIMSDFLRYDTQEITASDRITRPMCAAGSAFGGAGSLSRQVQQGRTWCCRDIAGASDDRATLLLDRDTLRRRGAHAIRSRGR